MPLKVIQSGFRAAIHYNVMREDIEAAKYNLLSSKYKQ